MYFPIPYDSIADDYWRFCLICCAHMYLCHLCLKMTSYTLDQLLFHRITFIFTDYCCTYAVSTKSLSVSRYILESTNGGISLCAHPQTKEKGIQRKENKIQILEKPLTLTPFNYSYLPLVMGRTNKESIKFLGEKM